MEVSWRITKYWGFFKAFVISPNSRKYLPWLAIAYWLRIKFKNTREARVGKKCNQLNSSQFLKGNNRHAQDSLRALDLLLCSYIEILRCFKLLNQSWTSDMPEKNLTLFFRDSQFRYFSIDYISKNTEYFLYLLRIMSRKLMFFLEYDF